METPQVVKEVVAELALEEKFLIREAQHIIVAAENTVRKAYEKLHSHIAEIAKKYDVDGTSTNFDLDNLTFVSK